ncbi:MAG: hypothetical protein ACRDJ4_09265 [Actinomycetota bacterium]
MIRELKVEGTAPAASEPKTNGTITLQDFSITLPDAAKTGKGTFRVVNNGPQPHETQLLRLLPGKTAADFQAFVQAAASGQPPGPPPVVEAGGMTVLPPGAHAFAFFDLEPGNYIAVCFVPDPTKNGMPHLAEGMVTPFTVS